MVQIVKRFTLLGMLIGLSMATVAAETEAPASNVDAAQAALPEAPKPVRRSLLRYPTKALTAEFAGDVDLDIKIDPDGEPMNIAVLGEYPSGYGFAESAVTSVKGWRFAPGKPGRYHLIVRFRIANAQRFILDGPVTDAPQPVKRIAAVYPIAARQRGLEARITVLVSLDKGEVKGVGVGQATDAKPSDETALFGDSAALAVSKWEFPETATGFFAVPITFSMAELEAGRVVRHRKDR